MTRKKPVYSVVVNSDVNKTTDAILPTAASVPCAIPRGLQCCKQDTINGKLCVEVAHHEHTRGLQSVAIMFNKVPSSPDTPNLCIL